jgi:hypothetical protein
LKVDKNWCIRIGLGSFIVTPMEYVTLENFDSVVISGLTMNKAIEYASKLNIVLDEVQYD